MTENIGSFIVSWDFSRDGDAHIVIVGNAREGEMHVINAFQGKDAHDIYNRLTTVKTDKEDNSNE